MQSIHPFEHCRRPPAPLLSLRNDSGLTLLEVLFATALVVAAGAMLYSVLLLSGSMIAANRQKLEAEALAMDRILEIFNTHNFTGTVLAVSLPARAPPAGSLLPPNTEIRALVIPNTGAAAPHKWDVEVRVKRDRLWLGGKKITLTNDTVYRVTRYNIERN